MFIQGTLGNVTFYKRNGTWVARTKTSLNKKRVKTDPAFEGSRRASAGFAIAAAIAKKIYWQLPVQKRGRGVIGAITGKVNSLVQKGYEPAMAETEVLNSFLK